MSSNSSSNAFMDTHNITVKPGADYENWIKLVKQKLKEREDNLMFARIKCLQSIINAECKSFENINSLNCCKSQQIKVANPHNVMHNGIVSQCLDKLHLIISLYQGINMRKTKKTPTTFHRYFTTAKIWFDQKKNHILAPDFWIKFFVSLEQFTSTAASRYFKNAFHSAQRLYAKQLLFRILCGIFHGELEYIGSKPQPLVPCSMLKDSEPMKQYLHTLHHTIHIDSLIQQNAASHRLNARDILELLKKQLVHLTNEYHQQFQGEFHTLCHDAHTVVPNTRSRVTDTGCIQSPDSSDSSSATPHSTCTPSSKHTVYTMYPPSSHYISQEMVRSTRFPEIRPPTVSASSSSNNAFAPSSSNPSTYTQQMSDNANYRQNMNNPDAFGAQPNSNERMQYMAQRVPMPVHHNAYTIPSTVSPSMQNHCSQNVFNYNDSLDTFDHRFQHALDAKSSETVNSVVESSVFEPFGESPAPPMLPPVLPPVLPPFDAISDDYLMNDWNSFDGGYNGNHWISHSVTAQRFNPMNRSRIFESKNNSNNCNYI